ncbi:hypothetical protein RHECNPAF_2530085 [Rhizobium etli CNPAF512]|nr:hypothetical protein RHECNPAF_2530085 [Rhizobium etli CNPAF512]
MVFSLWFSSAVCRPERAHHLVENGAGGLSGVGGFDDRTGDDEVGGPRLQCVERRHHPLLVAMIAAGRANAGGDDRHVGSEDLAHFGRLRCRTDDTTHAGGARLFGAAQHQAVRILVVAGLGKILGIHRGQHRDAEQTEAGAGRGLHSRPHRLGISVQRQHRHAHPGDVFDTRGDGVVDVEQLHVEKDLLAACREVTGEFQPAGKDQLIADLVEENIVTERGNQPFGLADRGNIQADDQPLACVHFNSPPPVFDGCPVA